MDILYFSEEGDKSMLNLNLGDGRVVWSHHMRYGPIILTFSPERLDIDSGFANMPLLQITPSNIIIYSDRDYIDRKVISNTTTALVISEEEFQRIWRGMQKSLRFEQYGTFKFELPVLPRV